MRRHHRPRAGSLKSGFLGRLGPVAEMAGEDEEAGRNRREGSTLCDRSSGAAAGALRQMRMPWPSSSSTTVRRERRESERRPRRPTSLMKRARAAPVGPALAHPSRTRSGVRVWSKLGVQL